MIKRCFIFSFLFLMFNLFSDLLSAQSDRVWAFGYHAGLDFNSGAPVPIQTNIDGFGEGQASICDASGQLLFYTEGSYVWDRNGNLMPNGSDLTGIVSTTTYTATSSTSQGVLILPMPGTTTKFYIFSLSSMEQNSMNNAGKLFYSIVDMTLNGGFGDVVAGEKGVLVATGLSERMTAVVGNRCNVWLLTCSVDERFHAYEVTHSGVDTVPVVSSVGVQQWFTGYMVVSPNRQKLAASSCFEYGNGLDGAALFDFDVMTGLVSNKVGLLPDFGGYGLAFSPDNSKLYVNADFQFIYQYDLSSGNAATIQASETLIGDATMTGLKLAPDGKIYFKSRYSGALGTINFPNSGGAAAGFVQNALALSPGTSCHSGLPNIVPVFDFDLDTAYSSTTVYPPCFFGNVFLTATDALTGWDYVWNDGTTGPERIVRDTGVYWVRYYTEPCTYTVDSFDVRYPSIETQNSCNDAANGMAWIKRAADDTTSYVFSWRDTSGTLLSASDTLRNVSSGSYLLNVSAPGCDFEREVLIERDDYTAAFVVDTLVCEQFSLSFENTSDTFFNQYDWQFGDGTASTLPSPEHVFAGPGHFTAVLVASRNGCSDTVYRDITVDPALSARFEMEPDSICLGKSIAFYPQVDATTVGLSWQFGDGTGRSSAPESATWHAYDQAGLFTVELSSQSRICPDTSFADTVYVFDLPGVDLGTDSMLCDNAPPIVLRNKAALAGESYTYRWNTGSTSEALVVTHPGRYSVRVSAGPLACSTTEQIVIAKGCYLDIPNAFTPNGDGANDYFFPRSLLSADLTAFRMQIFNRWGQIIFETTQWSGRGWDGKFNGKLQPEGVYVYIIDAEIGGTRKENYVGNLTLIR